MRGKSVRLPVDLKVDGYDSSRCACDMVGTRECTVFLCSPELPLKVDGSAEGS